MRVGEIRCSSPDCASEICGIEVGSDPVTFGGIIVARGKQDHGWCMECLIKKGKLRLPPPVQQDLFAEAIA